MLVVNYREHWLTDFVAIKEILLKEVGHLKTKVEHIGSTSIPGLAAKPIIDIDLVYSHLEQFREIAKKLTSLGYVHHGDQGISGREVFKRSTSPVKHVLLDSIVHHLYVCHESNEELKRHLLFREALKRDKQLRVNYESLKLDLARKANQNKKVYTQLKEKESKEFFESVFDLITNKK